MKNPKIVLVSQWDGWCGACAAERPLVLTRTGRQRLRTWFKGAADDSRPLVLTCRLCGTGVDVPLEQDDPPVVQSSTGPEALLEPPPAVEVATPVPVQQTSTQPLRSEPVLAPTAELTAARQDLAHALGALLAARTAEAVTPVVVVGAPVAAVAPVLAAPLVAAPTVAPSVPLQRTAASGGLAELQLLADGIDLLSSGRS